MPLLFSQLTKRAQIRPEARRIFGRSSFIRLCQWPCPNANANVQTYPQLKLRVT